MYGLPAVPEEIENYIQAASAEPAMEESAMFDAVVDVVMQGDYDYYIYDLVPLGHALYYLSMAKVYDEWINKVTKLREEMREYEEMVSRIRREKVTEQDQILQELLYIKNRINTSAGILTDKTKTAFFFVVIPEAGVINDTQKAAKMFAQFDVPLAGYVVNRVIPHELLDQNIPEYLRRRGRPRKPADLQKHECIVFQMPTSGRHRPWEFLDKGKPLVLHPRPMHVLNDGEGLVIAAAAGLGLVQAPDIMAAEALAAGALEEVLPGYRPKPMPISIVFASSRHMPARLRAFIDALAED